MKEYSSNDNAKIVEIKVLAYDVPIQPLIQLSESEYNRVLEVRSYITEGRWEQYVQDQTSLTRSENNIIFRVADQLYATPENFN